MRVTIVGAGLGGLCAAVALHAAGATVSVYDQATEFGEAGAGIQLGPNAIKVLRALGLEPGVKTFGMEPERHVGLDWKTGEVLFAAPTKGTTLARYGAQYRQVHRADLHALLREPLPAGAIHLNHQCCDVRTTARGATVRFTNGVDVESDVVIGADGLKSMVRGALFGADAPRFTGIMCWRGQVDVATLPERIVPNDSCHWMGPGGSIVYYRVRPNIVNFIAHRKTSQWTEESWSTEGDPAEMLAAFSGWHADVRTIIGAAGRVFKYALFDRNPLPNWSGGRVVLLGDAAHPMLPFLAQGGAMAMEDGLVLARCLQRDPDDVEAALQRFEALRKPRTTRVQFESRARAEVCQSSSVWSQFKRNLRYRYDRTFRPGAMQRSEWVYEYDAGSAA